MKGVQVLTATFLLLLIALVASSVSCTSPGGTVIVPPVIEGADFVGNKACADCHQQIAQKFPMSAHARVHIDKSGIVGHTGCESCHGPGSKHIQSGGGHQFIVNPGKEVQACFKCHFATHAEFNLPHNHPVMNGQMNCVQCHDPHGPDIKKPAGGLAMARQNESCAQCHRDQSRQFVFEHEALREGCTACHQPHGSVNRKLLTQADPNLCLRCHAQTHDPVAPGRVFIGTVEHTAFLRRATCWAAGCHTAVHGSNLDHRLRF